jgi:hypothetical protein
MGKTFLRALGFPVLAFFLGAACNLDPGKPLDTGIMFKVLEYHAQTDSAPVTLLSMQTKKVYSCCNYAILSGLVQLGDELTVNISGIQAPEICLPALGPAGGSHYLALPEGTYSLSFARGLQPKDTYTLTVTRASFEIKAHDSSFTEPSYTIYWRYPANSFAYVCGTMTDTTWIYDDFLAVLMSQVELEEIHFPENGEICYPRASQGHYVDMPARYFIYKTEADFEKAGEILQSYSESIVSQHSGVSIYLRNWKDRSFRSWLPGENGQ